jgi:glycosyltransferase involved in cell wall biosynthesis
VDNAQPSRVTTVEESPVPIVFGLTTGAHQPGTRFRWQQHVAHLVDAGWDARTLAAAHDAYPPVQRWKRPAWGARAALDAWARVRKVNATPGAIAFLQRNLVSTLVTAEPWLRRPFVLDVDDAIFLGTRGASADRIARRASLILCGNGFLAEHFARFGEVRLLPTAVDTDVFHPAAAPAPSPVIGWSGSSSGLPYVYAIESALTTVAQRRPKTRLRIVSDRPPEFRTFPAERVDFVRWTPSIDASVLRSFTVGLMPLDDSPWSRGKCSFKMLTCMASGVPVVVSPVGMNTEVLALGRCGIGASTHDEWVDALTHLIDDADTAGAMGAEGRRIVEQRFSRAIVGADLERLLREVIVS